MTPFMLICLLFGSIHATTLTNATDVEVRSTLNRTQDKVLIDIQLPSDSEVGFEIYNGIGAIKHLWHTQSLDEGRHQLALTLPALEAGKYLLHIKVNDTVYKHLVFLPSGK